MKKSIWLMVMSFWSYTSLCAQTAIQQDSIVPLEECDVMHPLLHEFPTDNYVPFISKSISEDVKLGQVNFLAVLKNQISGLTVSSSSGAPGTAVYARIRGNNSIMNNGSPLIILDGIPINNDTWGFGTGNVDLPNRLIDLNANDIESVKIFKGPASTVKHGLRGGNGVIEITTKSGMDRRYRASVTSSIWTNSVNKLPARQSQYAQGRPTSGFPTYRGPETGEGFSWGPEISKLEFDGDGSYAFDQNGRLVPRGTGSGEPAVAYDPYTFFINGFAHQLNATVGGSGTKSDYVLSVGRTISNGYAPKANFVRNNFFGKANLVFNSMFRSSLSVHMSNSRGYRLQRGSNIKGVMLGTLRTTPTFDNGNGKTGKEAANDLSSFQLESGAQRSYRSGIYDNPYWSVNKNPFEDETLRFIGNYSMICAQPLPIRTDHWLEGRVGLDHYTDNRRSALDINPGRSLGQVDITDLKQNTFFSSITANARGGNDSGWNYKTQLGVDYFQFFFRDTTTNGENMLTPGSYVIENTQTQEGNRFTRQRKMAGVMASLDLRYEKWLTFNFSARNDWSSALSFKTGNFLSYGTTGSLMLSELINPVDPENPPKNKILDHLNVTVGYGRVANDAPTYLTQNYYTPPNIGGDGFISASTVFGYEIASFLGNDELKPESTTSYEISLSLGLWDRIGFDLTYYDAYTTDIVLMTNIPASSGFLNTVENGGEISNKGIEIDFYATPIKTAKFSWDLTLNFTKAENIVEKIPEFAQDIQLAGFTSTSSRIFEGHPYSVIWGDAFLRNESGQLIIDDNGWPLVDSDKKILGDPNPDWTAGIYNRIKIGKNLSVSALLDIKMGGDMWCGTCGVLDYFGVTLQSAEERNDSRVFEGVTQNGDPNTVEVDLANPQNGMGSYYRVRYGFGFSEMNVVDASWVRLRTVAIQYDLVLGESRRIPIDNISFSLFANNLWLKTDYPGIDPETNLTGPSNGFGLDYYNMPGARSYGISVKLNL
jgi:TonB-dependent SusC/RagA subfamily outer membrane receptor